MNYLPLWNPLLFILMPPNTILGPITGGSKFLKKPLSYFLEEYQELDVVAEEFNMAFQIESEKIQENK